MAEWRGLTAAELRAAERRAWWEIARLLVLLVAVVVMALLMLRAVGRDAWVEAIFWLLMARGLPRG